MNHTAVEDLLIREETVTKTAATVVTSPVRCWKEWGRDYTKDLVLSVWVHGAKSLTAGSVTLTLLSGDTEATCTTSIATATGAVAGIDENGRIITMPLPRTGIKKYVKVQLTVGTAFSANPVISVGLDNDAEFGYDQTMLQAKVVKPA